MPLLFFQQTTLTPAWGLLAIANPLPVTFLLQIMALLLRSHSLSLSVKIAYSEKTISRNNPPTPTKLSCNATLFYFLHIP